MPTKQRGPLLTVWLALMLAANVFTVYLYALTATSPLAHSIFLPSVAHWAIYSFIILGALNLVCVSFLFLWKKWAFFTLCGSAGAAFAINLYVGVGPYAFVGLAGIAVFIVIIRTKWSQLTNF